MPCARLKNSFIHRLFLCYYCTPEDERPKRKVRPPKKGRHAHMASAETQTNISVSNSGNVAFQCSYTNNNNNNQSKGASSSLARRPDEDQSDGLFSSSFASSDTSGVNPDVTPEVLMTWVSDVLSEDLVQEVNAIYKFVIVDDNKLQSVYYLDLKNGQGSVGVGEPSVDPDVVLSSSLKNMQLLMNGKLSKVSAFLTGRLKVEGDKNAAYNLDKVITLVQQS